MVPPHDCIRSCRPPHVIFPLRRYASRFLPVSVSRKLTSLVLMPCKSEAQICHRYDRSCQPLTHSLADLMWCPSAESVSYAHHRGVSEAMPTSARVRRSPSAFSERRLAQRRSCHGPETRCNPSALWGNDEALLVGSVPPILLDCEEADETLVGTRGRCLFHDGKHSTCEIAD